MPWLCLDLCYLCWYSHSLTFGSLRSTTGKKPYQYSSFLAGLSTGQPGWYFSASLRKTPNGEKKRMFTRETFRAWVRLLFEWSLSYPNLGNSLFRTFPRKCATNDNIDMPCCLESWYNHDARLETLLGHLFFIHLVFCFWNFKCQIMDFSKNPKFFQLFILLTYK